MRALFSVRMSAANPAELDFIKKLLLDTTQTHPPESVSSRRY